VSDETPKENEGERATGAVPPTKPEVKINVPPKPAEAPTAPPAKPPTVKLPPPLPKSPEADLIADLERITAGKPEATPARPAPPTPPAHPPTPQLPPVPAVGSDAVAALVRRIKTGEDKAATNQEVLIEAMRRLETNDKIMWQQLTGLKTPPTPASNPSSPKNAPLPTLPPSPDPANQQDPPPVAPQPPRKAARLVPPPPVIPDDGDDQPPLPPVARGRQQQPQQPPVPQYVAPAADKQDHSVSLVAMVGLVLGVVALVALVAMFLFASSSKDGKVAEQIGQDRSATIAAFEAVQRAVIGQTNTAMEKMAEAAMFVISNQIHTTAPPAPVLLNLTNQVQVIVTNTFPVTVTKQQPIVINNWSSSSASASASAKDEEVEDEEENQTSCTWKMGGKGSRKQKVPPQPGFYSAGENFDPVNGIWYWSASDHTRNFRNDGRKPERVLPPVPEPPRRPRHRGRPL